MVDECSGVLQTHFDMIVFCLHSGEVCCEAIIVYENNFEENAVVG